MPLVPNDTDGALTRKRLETWVAKEEKVTVVAATDAATVQAAATLAAAAEVVYTMTPTATRTLTTPTGAELGAAFTDEAVGSSFRFTVVNGAAVNTRNHIDCWCFWCNTWRCCWNGYYCSSKFGIICCRVYCSKYSNYLPQVNNSTKFAVKAILMGWEQPALW
jgi:hypothetical protein